MDLSQTPHSHKSSLHGKGSSRHGKINGRDRNPAEIDINPTNTLKTDRENINQKDDTNLINETSPNITNWFERTKKQNIDVSKPDVFIFTLRFAFMLVLVDVQKLHGCLYTTGH
jgi:hypothetical protein